MRVTDTKGKLSKQDIEKVLSKANRCEVRNRLGRDGTTDELLENFHLKRMEEQFQNERQAI